MPRVASDEFPEMADDLPEDKKEQLEQLYKAVRKLPDVERALVLLYLDDCSYKEMEQVMGIIEPTLRVKMNRIKEKLRQLLIAEI